MSALKDFLQSEAQKRQERLAETRKKRDDWIMAVRALTTQLKAWVDESNKEAQVLQTDLEMVQLAEQEIGTYNAQSLVISLDPQIVRVTPVARNVVGRIAVAGVSTQASGRIDITDGARKYILYRVHPDSWMVVDPNTYEARKFNREEFENILQDLLA